MEFSQKSWLAFSAAVLLMGAVWIGETAQVHGSSSAEFSAPQTGFAAPDFELETLDGELVRLSDLEGQVVVVNFWATWCAPCRAEMPAIQQVFSQYADRGLVVLAVNTTYNDSADAAAEFVEEYGLSFPVLLDKDAGVSRLYQLQGTPTTFFIGRDGLVQDVVLGGSMAEGLLLTRVESLLAGVQP